MMSRFKKKKNSALVNLTGLIDILFLLIIFFVVTNQFDSSKIKEIDLPKSTEKKSANVEAKLIINVDAEQRIMIRKKMIEFEQLETFFRENQFTKETIFILNIDKKIEHGFIIQLLDMLQSQNITKIAFGTQTR